MFIPHFIKNKLVCNKIKDNPIDIKEPNYSGELIEDKSETIFDFDDGSYSFTEEQIGRILRRAILLAYDAEAHSDDEEIVRAAYDIIEEFGEEHIKMPSDLVIEKAKRNK